MNKFLLAAIIIGAFLVLSSFVLAAENDTNITLTGNETGNVTLPSDNITNVTIPSGNLTGNLTNRCDNLNNRINFRINQFDDGKVRRINSYNNALDKINKALGRLSAKGVDISTLESDLVSLNASIDKFNVDYTLFITKLQGTKNFTCGHSHGEFVGALGDAKTQMKLVHDDAQAVKVQIDKLKVDLENLRNVEQENKIQNKTGDRPNGFRNGFNRSMMNRSNDGGRRFNDSEGMINRTGMRPGEFGNRSGPGRFRNDTLNRTEGSN